MTTIWEQVTITITPPGGQAWSVSTTLTPSTDRGLQAVQYVGLKWGRPTPRDHEAPGTIEARFLADQPDAIPTGSLISVQAHLTDPDLFEQPEPPQLGYAWVTEVEWDKVSDGRWIYNVTADNAVARAAGVYLAAEPWPLHYQAERLQAINDAAGYDAAAPGWVQYADTDGVRYAPRDVDRFNCLEAIQLTTRSPELVVVETDYGLTQCPLPGPRLLWPRRLFAPHELQWSASDNLVRIPANAIATRPRRRNRTSRVNQATLKWRLHDLAAEEETFEDISRTIDAAGPRTETSNVTRATDLWLTAAEAADSPGWHWLRGVLATCSQDVPVLDATQIITRRLPALTTAQLVRLAQAGGDHEAGYRSTVHAQIVGDVPSDVATDQTLCATSLTIYAGLRKVELLTELQPLSLAGAAGARFGDFPTDAQVAGTDYIGVRFRDTGTVTARQLAAVTINRPF